MRSLFVLITWIYFTLPNNGFDLPGVRLRQLLQEDLCCRSAGEEQGLLCGCRQACTGNSCNAGTNFGIAASCGTGVCCCGTGCVKQLQPGLDSCPTQQPTINPTKIPSANPSTNPTKNPSKDPSANPSKNPTKNPTANPSVSPSQFPSANPSVSPTVPQCAIWQPIPETTQASSSTSTTTGNPSEPESPQLCQLGKSGTWSSLDKWYSQGCSCYEPSTLFKLTQFVGRWFYEWELNYNQQAVEGRFESYFENYSVQDIFLRTSFSDQPRWLDLESLTSCDPSNPGYPELTRTLAQNTKVSFVLSRVFIRECVENGAVANARLKINLYRVFSNQTENSIVSGDIIVKRQENTNIWLFKSITFNTRQTVGFLTTEQP